MALECNFIMGLTMYICTYLVKCKPNKFSNWYLKKDEKENVLYMINRSTCQFTIYIHTRAALSLFPEFIHNGTKVFMKFFARHS